MSNPSNHNQPSNNYERGPVRHRFWPMLAVLVLCAGTIALVADRLTAPSSRTPPSSGEVAVSLPPSVSVPSASKPSPPSASSGQSPLAPAAGPQAAPPAQTALLPRPPQDTPAIPSSPSAQPSPLSPGTQPAEAPAWLRFATAVPADVRDRPRIAIVIDDLGLDRARTERVIGLPAAVTLSFLAYSGDLPRLAAAARHNGHEMIVHVPMEPVNAKMDMGPNGLATNQPREEVLRRLDWDLGRFDGYVGINNHMGSRFTGDTQAMGWVMDELKSRGLMFLDSRTIATSIGAKAAAADGVPFAERDVFLDDDQSALAVEQRLKEVEAIARKKGTAIAIGHPHDATIETCLRRASCWCR
jgi:polysaccharide deacetylase 2 family uncharacterized protein YibQ